MIEQAPGKPSRGDLMRQIAALHARMAIGFGKEEPPAATELERQEIVRQIVALEKQLMEM